MTTNEIFVSDRAGEAVSTNGVRNTSKPGQLTRQGEGEQAPSTPNELTRPPVENADPIRRRIRNPRRGIIYRLMKFLRGIFFPELTAEQRAKLSEKQARQALHKALHADALTAEKRMIKRLKDLGICYEYKKRDGSFSRYATIKFDRVKYEPNAIWLHVDTQRLPFGVSTEQLKQKEVVDNLGLAVGHAVSVQWSVEKGIWYVVERASGAMGIPNHVQLTDLWKRMPEAKDNLTIPIGLSNNSRPIFESISDMTHILVAGSTGSGKSNFMNVVLCTLVRFNSPDRLRMVLVDLKGGMEFSFYKDLPHLIRIPDVADTGIVNDRDKVEDLLNWLVGEGERRMKIFTDAKAKNIAKYNSHRKVKMPRILVVIDEWADVMYSKRHAATETALVNVVQRMRAVGIHVMLCTQYPKKEVLTGLVKGNLPAKFAFSTTNNAGSINILDNGMAAHLHPEGRCVFQWAKEIIVQTPYIPDSMVTETVEGAISGQFVALDRTHDVTLLELMQWALANNHGEMQLMVLYNQFKERHLTKDEIYKWLVEGANKEHLVGAILYKLMPKAGNLPYRLVPVETAPEDDHQHAEAQP